MTMSDIANPVPTDPKGSPYNRAMGCPILADDIILGSTEYVDIFNLEDYGDRAFIGISIHNPDNDKYVKIAIGPDFTEEKCISIHPGGFVALDNQLFGAGMANANGNAIKKLRAALDATEGTLATGTITYSGTNVTNGKCVRLNGTVFEFSDDQSAAPGHVKVDIGASADLSWTALRDAIIANEQALIASINTATNILTLTSNYGGTQGNAIPIVDGDENGANTTGAVFSAATLAGGVGGFTPVITIW